LVSRATTSLRTTVQTRLDPRLCLVLLNQVTNALRIRLAVSVAGDGVGAARRFDDDLCPEHARRNVNGRDLRHRNALLVAAEQARLDTRDPLRADHQASGKEKVALRPA